MSKILNGIFRRSGKENNGRWEREKGVRIKDEEGVTVNNVQQDTKRGELARNTERRDSGT